jgi:sphinganine C4-monooxygenase
MATNATAGVTLPMYSMPALPEYTLKVRPAIVQGLPDALSQMLMLIFAYWATSAIFHVIDVYDWFPQYRLHTPAEITKRNKVTRYEVFRDVIVQQIVQTLFGVAIAWWDPPEMMGKEQYDIAVWALRLRVAQSYLPAAFGLIGVDSVRLATKSYQHYPTVAAVIGGGAYQSPGFASWELQAGWLIYHVLVPFLQFSIAIVLVDTWQYFVHRAMHMNKFLYTWLHARHHRLYVPYAYGALYNHPVEGFILDTVGTGSAYLLTGMTVRQGMAFFTAATIKTVDDHCGYHFPWDPLQHLTGNNAAYHDIHHQSWGIKTKFSQPFGTFWDRFLGTKWTGGDVSSRYERDRIAAQKKVDADAANAPPTVTNSPAVDLNKAQKQAQQSQQQVLDDPKVDGRVVIAEEEREEREVKQQTPRRSTRRSVSGFDPKAISDRMAGSLHGRSTAILHADGLR